MLRPRRRRQKEDRTAICNCLTGWGEAMDVGSFGSDMMEQEDQAMARDILLCSLPSSQGSGLRPCEIKRSLSLEVLGKCCAAFSQSPLLRAGPAFSRALHWCQSDSLLWGSLGEPVQGCTEIPIQDSEWPMTMAGKLCPFVLLSS